MQTAIPDAKLQFLTVPYNIHEFKGSELHLLSDQNEDTLVRYQSCIHAEMQTGMEFSVAGSCLELLQVSSRNGFKKIERLKYWYRFWEFEKSDVELGRSPRRSSETTPIVWQGKFLRTQVHLRFLLCIPKPQVAKTLSNDDNTSSYILLF